MANSLLYLSKASLLLLFQLLVIQSASFTNARGNPQFSKSLKDLEGSQKGQRVQGIHEVKHYLNKFGYLNYEDSNNVKLHVEHDDEFDEAFELALKTYQKYYHLKVTGKLDSDTIKQMARPRCGVADVINGNLEHEHPQYAFFGNQIKWPSSKRHLTYAFESSAQVDISLEELRSTCESAFKKWSEVSDFTFEETDQKLNADLVLGFHRLDHGDGNSFDGPSGVLAHAFAPTNGRLHFDADEDWSTSLNLTRSETDLVSVATHEIGHLLGLAHSQFEDAIMYAYFATGVTKRDLNQDDIEGIRALYADE